MSSSWLLMQLGDSGFPTGGFAHSQGLEAAWAVGALTQKSAADRISEVAIQLGRAGLPFASSAHQEPECLETWDDACEAFLGHQIARRASRVQGMAFLDTCARIFGDRLEPLRERVRGAGLSCHHAPIFGAALAGLGLCLEQTQRLYLSLGVRAALSAAVRLSAIGTHEAQRIHQALHPLLERTLTECGPLRAADAAQTAPLLDLLQSTHDRLYSRLFLS